MPRVQVWYLVVCLAKTVIASDDLWECYFPLGLAWITIVDGLNLILQSKQSFRQSICVCETKRERGGTVIDSGHNY